jgi:hypothetical protein
MHSASLAPGICPRPIDGRPAMSRGCESRGEHGKLLSRKAAVTGAHGVLWGASELSTAVAEFGESGVHASSDLGTEARMSRLPVPRLAAHAGKALFHPLGEAGCEAPVNVSLTIAAHLSSRGACGQ